MNVYKEGLGIVSLWLGRAKSKQALDAYLKYGFTPEGDAIRSAFMRDFHTKHFETGCWEVTFYDTPTISVGEIVRECSYEDVVGPSFISQLGDKLAEPINASVMLYDLDYSGAALIGGNELVQLRFLGKTSYR